MDEELFIWVSIIMTCVLPKKVKIIEIKDCGSCSHVDFHYNNKGKTPYCFAHQRLINGYENKKHDETFIPEWCELDDHHNNEEMNRLHKEIRYLESINELIKLELDKYESRQQPLPEPMPSGNQKT